MKTISDLINELRDIDHEPTRQQQMGVIRYLQQLRVGSIVDTPDGRGVVTHMRVHDRAHVGFANGYRIYNTEDLKVVG